MLKKIALKKIFWLLVVGIFVLTACNAAEDGADADDTVALIYTSVAETMTALPTEIVATATPVVVPSTITPVATQTVVAQVLAQPSPTFAVVQQAVCQDALYMSDVTIPDGTIMAAGESFEKTWLLLNGGTCAWEETYLLTFVSGEEMSGVATAVGSVVAANGQAQLSVTFTAPLTAGTYNSYWQMTDGAGTTFGNTIFVNIIVSDESTRTATITATSEYTATPENTSTPAETATATSTVTETPTP